MPIKKPLKKKDSNSPSVVIGIGASAGSIRLLKTLTSRLKKTQNTAAFIIVQHLDKEARKSAFEGLSSVSDLPVLEIKKGLKIDAGKVYWAPPHTSIKIIKERFETKAAKTTQEKLSVIDHSFESIADHYGSSTVGVLLSGDASDGTAGLKAINNAGGLTVVQDPKTAEHKSMLESAISSGVVDHIAEPSKIVSVIQANAAYISKIKSSNKDSELEVQISSAIGTICEVLQKYTSQDFKHYKTSTLVRRIQRRMQVLRINAVHTYVEFLSESKDEAEALFRELLINVTSFFRDKASFKALESDVLSRLITEHKQGEKIRIWVAGCSTGEEAYSIAMLINELLSKRSERPEVQIIATDIDSQALNIARKGSYPISIEEHVPREFLEKYFTKRGSRYHVTKQLREYCLFSIHNLITDPPFSQIDLISCRNVIIYLGSHLQRKLFPVFHYALKKNGYLFLGTSESIAAHKELFKAIDPKHRIAQKKITAIRLPSQIPSSVNHYLSQFQEASKDDHPNLSLISQRIALDEIPLKYAVVNDDGHIISSSAGLSKYVEIGEGPFQNSIVKLSLPSLRPALRKAFSLAKKEKRKVVDETSSVRFGQVTERVGIIVQPMPQLGLEAGLYWIAFQYLGMLPQSIDQTRIKTHPASDPDLVDQLEREVFILREELDKSVQDLEASNEELKSSNEELLSMNEELQSANEEMETSKEEIQSVNEALQRVNADLENLLAGTQIATLFLDRDLKIRGFTPAISEIYSIQQNDIDRDIRLFNSRVLQMPPYPLQVEGAVEEEVKSPEGRYYLRRILPYLNHENIKDGFVVTFIDVTSLRLLEEARRESEKLFQVVANAAPALIWLSGLDKKRIFFNHGWLEYTGYSLEDSLGEGWRKAVHPDDLQKYLDLYSKHFDERSEFYIEYRLKHRSGRYRWIGARGVPRQNSEGVFEGFIGACLDIHEQKLARESLMQNQRQMEMMIKTSPSFMAILKGSEFVFETMNEQYKKLIGHRDVIGKPMLAALPEIESQGYADILRKVIETGEPFIGNEYVVYLQREPSAELERRYIDFVYQPFKFIDGHSDGILVHGVDVTEKVLARTSIENERQNFRNLFKQTPEMVCILKGPDHEFEFVNEAHIKALGFDATGRTVRDAQPESVEVHGILDDVYRTGKTAELHEIPVTLSDRVRYFNLTYSARFDEAKKINGVMILGLEVTEQVLTRESYKLQRDALELALNGAPMKDVLTVIAKMVELQVGGDLLASVLLTDKKQKHLIHGAAPRLSDEYNKAIHGMEIGENVGSCGTAAHSRGPVIVEDILSDSRWSGFRELAKKENVRACWSMPIMSSQDKLLGTFALYSRTARKPTQHELRIVDVATQITALILERQFEISERIEREEQIAFATESAKMGTWTVTLPDNKVFLSEAAAKLFGFTNEFDSTDFAIDTFIHKDDREHAKSVLAKALANRSLYDDYYRIVRPSGEVRWINSRGHFRFDQNGNVTALSGLIIDVTTQKENELVVESAKKAAEAASDAKTRFLANMSHEIRTPLSAIIGYSELLHSHLAPDKASHGYVERISRNANQLARLINELLDLSKIEADKLEIEKVPVDVDNLIEDVYSTMVLRAEAKGLSLNFNWSSRKPSSIITDPLRLSQILVNIVGNAVKFTEQGTVNVNFSMRNSNLIIEVTDTGIGLSEEQKTRIFDPFMQADSSVSRRYGGTGLGLALSKRLARLLGGDLVLDFSEIGEGSVFRIEIPVSLQAYVSQLPQEKEAPVKTEKVSLAGKKILIVDDSPDNRLIVSMFLQSTEAVIIEATNGEEGVRLATSEAPDIILMDIQMPIMDGYQAIQRLREINFKNPVIALTAHAFKEERERCEALGFDEYITKPINRTLLQQTIYNLLFPSGRD